MALSLDLQTIANTTELVEDFTSYGTNINTARKDDRAWERWEEVCRRFDTSSVRTSKDVRDNPERNTHLMTCLLLHAFAMGKPRDRTRQFIKPRSALAYPLAIRRIFRRWGIEMPGYKALVAQMQGLCRLYVTYHGPHSLAPRRAEPMRFATMP